MFRFLAFVMLAMLAMLAFIPPSLAYSPDRPSRRDVFSPGGKYVLDINPETNTHIIYLADNRKTPLWSFSKELTIATISQIFLSDSGKTVAIVAWQFAHGEGDCITFWDRTGKIKSYPFSEICPSPRMGFPWERGPIGGINFIWCDHVVRDEVENTLRITTSGWYEYTFSMETGAILSREFLARNVIYRLWFYLLLVFGTIALWLLAKWRRHRLAATPVEGERKAAAS